MGAVRHGGARSSERDSMKIQRIDPERCFRDNRLYADYLAGRGAALNFYTHAPHDFRGALDARRKHSYPRGPLVERLRGYNERIGANDKAIQNIDRLSDGRAYCIITGQQAGFLGGPVYTLYKIVTALRLAERCAGTLDIAVVPVFWLATDDHDLNEVNHAHVPGEDGEISAVQFPAVHDGMPVESLICSPDIAEAYERYFGYLAAGTRAGLLPAGAVEAAREAVPPPRGERYGEWIARIWSNLFSHRGLVIVEPSALRPLAGEFFRRAVELHEKIADRIRTAGTSIRAGGYDPVPLSPQAGVPFRFDESGRRVRVERPDAHAGPAAEHPERYSADVLLRPLMVDSLIPVLAHVLGPGEIAYHAYLKSLYELFGIAQPLLFPRKSYTVIRKFDAERLEDYGRTVEEVLCRGAFVSKTPETDLPEPGGRLFDEARAGIEKALAPLRPYVEGIDPGLVKTHRRTASQAQRALDTLRERTMRARMSGGGMSKGSYRRLVNIIMPKGKMQERIFPLPFLIALAPHLFPAAILEAGEIDDFSHVLITLEAGDE